MIRVLIYLVIVALLAFGAVWLAERPGDVVITWQGERVETSVMVLMAAAAAVAVAAVTAVVDRARDRALARRGLALPAQSPRRARLPGGVARADRGRLRRCPRRQEVHRRGQADRAERAAHLAAERAGGAARRRPRRGRRHLPADGGPRRHQGARPARPVRRGAAAQRPRRRAVLCRGGRQAGRGPALGRAGGAGIPLRRRRLERRAHPARAQHEERADRQDRLQAPARGAAHRAGARGRRRRCCRRHRASPMPVANARRRSRSRR